MAKKAVATLREGSMDGRAYTKVIKMVRSPKTGAYVFDERPQACEIDELVEKKFEGSLPTFIAAFTRRQDLSDRELDEVQQMIDRIRRGETR